MQVVLAFPQPLLLVNGTLPLPHVLAADRPAGEVQMEDEPVHHRPVLHFVQRLPHHRRQLLTRTPGVVGELLVEKLLEEDSLSGLPALWQFAGTQ